MNWSEDLSTSRHVLSKALSMSGRSKKYKPYAAFKLNVLLETFPVYVAPHFIN